MNVSQMTIEELRTLIAEVVEEKIAAFIDDEGEYEINDSLKRRLIEQKRQVENGERGVPMAQVLKDLGLS